MSNIEIGNKYALFFDIDGTLFDTRADLAATVNHTRSYVISLKSKTLVQFALIQIMAKLTNAFLLSRP